jgi:hypothetical protein
MVIFVFSGLWRKVIVRFVDILLTQFKLSFHSTSHEEYQLHVITTHQHDAKRGNISTMYYCDSSARNREETYQRCIIVTHQHETERKHIKDVLL